MPLAMCGIVCPRWRRWPRWWRRWRVSGGKQRLASFGQPFTINEPAVNTIGTTVNTTKPAECHASVSRHASIHKYTPIYRYTSLDRCATIDRYASLPR